MKLDVEILRYLTPGEFRVLTAIEMGMKNHELVPTELIETIAGLKHTLAYKYLSNLHKHKLVFHDSRQYDGYRLTFLGYDYLALKYFVKRNVICGVGSQIGVGKESDIFEVVNDEQKILILKLHRLGRVSFRQVKQKRDYMEHRKSAANQLYMSRLSAMREFKNMKLLQESDFSVPEPIDSNRHCILMSRVEGQPLYQVRHLTNPHYIFEQFNQFIIRLGEDLGLVHCDFNEFNIMIKDEKDDDGSDGKITIIDFPQMIKIDSDQGRQLFERDQKAITTFFEKRFKFYLPDQDLDLKDDVNKHNYRTRSYSQVLSAQKSKQDLENVNDIESCSDEDEDTDQSETILKNSFEQLDIQSQQEDDEKNDVLPNQKRELTGPEIDQRLRRKLREKQRREKIKNSCRRAIRNGNRTKMNLEIRQQFSTGINKNNIKHSVQ